MTGQEFDPSVPDLDIDIDGILPLDQRSLCEK